MGRKNREKTGNVFKSVIVRDFIFSFKKMLHKRFGGRAPFGTTGELKLSHRPLSSEGYGREYSLAAIRCLCGEGDGVEIRGRGGDSGVSRVSQRGDQIFRRPKAHNFFQNLSNGPFYPNLSINTLL